MEPRKVIETCLEALQEVDCVLQMIPTSVADKVRLALSTATCFLEGGNEPAGVSNEEEGKADEGRGSCGRGRRLCGEGIGATAMAGYPESKGKSCRSSAACLPQEILLHILRLVPRQRRPTILACCLVNKAWHQAAMYLLWEVLDTDVDSFAFLCCLPVVEAKASNTRSLRLCSLTNCSGNDHSFDPMPIPFPFYNLRALAMERVRFNVPDLAQIFDACPNIVALAIDCWVDSTIDETADVNAVSASLCEGFGRLQSFAIWEGRVLVSDPADPGSTPPEIALISLAVSSFGSSLRALVCNMWAGYRYFDLFSPLASQCQNLVHLSLSSCYDVIPLIACSPNLVQLRCLYDPEAVDAVVKNCPHLRRVVIESEVTVNHFIEAKPPQAIEALRIEYLENADQVNWGGLLAHLGNNLKLLDVECGLREGVVKALMLGFSTGLRVLTTNDLDEYEIWELKQKCPALEKIFVESSYSKAFMEAARRKGVEVRPKLWWQAVCLLILQNSGLD